MPVHGYYTSMENENNNKIPELDLREDKDGRVRSGKARMEKLTPDQRSALGRQGANARWAVERIDPGSVEKVFKASHTGELQLRIGEKPLVIPCANLNDGVTRVISRNAIFRAFGRTKRGRAKDENRVPNMPSFIDAKNLQPFVCKHIGGGLKLLVYEDLKGRMNQGYNAILLPQLCNVYLEARRQGNVLTKPQESLAIAAEILLGALGTVGIIALIDEATGFQNVRDREALQEILNLYIGKELAKWAKRFPDEFYKETFRLRGWQYDPTSSKRPMLMARLTIDLVYDRIGPGLTKELQERREEIFDTTGKRGKLQQLLTPDVGHPALQYHLSGLIFLGRASSNWDDFYLSVEKVAPRYNRTLRFPFEDSEAISISASEPQPPALQSPSA